MAREPGMVTSELMPGATAGVQLDGLFQVLLTDPFQVCALAIPEKNTKVPKVKINDFMVTFFGINILRKHPIISLSKCNKYFYLFIVFLFFWGENN